MKNSNRRERRPLRYRVDRLVRSTVMRVIGWLAPKGRPQTVKSSDSFKRILLVRTNYRIGNAILTLPAIQAFRARYPEAEIDFVGAPIARVLFENQSLNHSTTRRGAFLESYANFHYSCAGCALGITISPWK